MKFQEKLIKIRKEKNLSQEALAEKLGMSRQAISKWESGTSYPDMATIIRLAKTLDCKIDDLIDDDVIGKKNETNKFNINNLLKDILEFITKTYNMFWSMKFTTKIKCIIELFVIIVGCYFVSDVFGLFLKDTVLKIFLFLPNSIYNYIFIIFKMLYSLLMFVISCVVTIHLFKIRYLDYYVTIEDKNINNKVIEKDNTEDKNKRFYNKEKQEKIIIRDAKHSTNSIISLLGRMIKLLLKIFAVFIIMFLIFGFITVVFLGTVSLFWIKYGLIFLGFNILSIGVLAFIYIFIELMYEFIFDRGYNFKRLFIIFISSLIVMGIGSGVVFLELSTFDYITNIKFKNSTVLRINVKDDTLFTELEYYEKQNKVVIDNSVKDIEVLVEYSDYIKPNIYMSSDNNYYIDYKVKENNIVKYILNDIKNRKINFDSYYDYNVKEIKISKSNYDKIINNNKKYLEIDEEKYFDE